MGLVSASLATLWAQAGLSAPPTARVNVCSKSSQEGRDEMRAGHLRRAREVFMQCAKTSCGGTVAQQCRSALQQLDMDTPSVVPVVIDGAGVQRVDVRVTMDGEVLTSRIDGRSLIVDPGLHEFTFTTDQGDVHAEKILVLEGQRNRVISVELAQAAGAPAKVAAVEPVAPPAPDVAEAASEEESVRRLEPAELKRDASPPRQAASSRSTTPVLSYIVGGAGLAAVGSSFLLAHWGREDSILLDRCAPNCTQQSVDHVSNMYIAADITLGVGVVALGAATWLYLTRPEVEDTTSARTLHIDIQPTASGAYATVGSAF